VRKVTDTLLLKGENEMNKYSDKVKRAIDFAMEKHCGQFRKGTDIPYINHPLEALEIVSSITDDDDVLCAAVLHDVIEDAGVTFNELKEQFGEEVALLVADESEDKREELPAAITWKLRKEESLKHLQDASKEAKIVALGDKLSNILAIRRDYDKIGDELWLRFNCKEKSEQGWYYSSMRSLFLELSGTDAYKEFTTHVEAVFETRN